MQLSLLQDIESESDEAPQEARRKSARIRYIGSKSRVAEALLAIIGKPKFQEQRLVDLFCGSGAVSCAAASAGWRVHINDHLVSAVTITKAQLLFKEVLDFKKVGGYDRVISDLNNVPSLHGPIFREYSPSGKSLSGHDRKYFIPENASKIDGVRHHIQELYEARKIDENVRLLLIADLISAVNQVANIAGTYGCYLSQWTAAARSKIRLSPRQIPTHLPFSTSSTEDAFEMTDAEEDVLYCDPPYTKRQYAAYYHILETITLGDYPEVDGVAGIRPWKEKSSPFCYKRRALDAFNRLLLRKSASRIYVSYSSEGHVTLDELSNTLAQFGSIRVHQVMNIRRYAPNEVSRSKTPTVTEFLIEVRR